eukprot:g4863.t1
MAAFVRPRFFVLLAVAGILLANPAYAGEEECDGRQLLTSAKEKGLSPSLRGCRELHFQRHVLSADDIRALAQAMQDEATELHVLDLSFQILGDGKFRMLYDGLIHCKELRVLSLRGNGLTATAARVLAALLDKLSQLEVLDISWNNISDNGVKFLCEAFTGHVHLRALTAHECDIGEEGAHILAGHLERLHILDLSANAVKDNGFLELLSKAVQPNARIHELRLSENLITDAALPFASKVIKERVQTGPPSLQRINLRYNTFSEELLHRLVRDAEDEGIVIQTGKWGSHDKSHRTLDQLKDTLKLLDGIKEGMMVVNELPSGKREEPLLTEERDEL